MNKPIIYFVLLILCVLSRLLTGISFVEDPESLAIFNKVTDPSLTNTFNDLESPLFSQLVKSFSLITNNYSVSFSIIGGISTFFIIVYILLLIKVPLASLEGGFTFVLLFFNPLIWISANRYTPDLASTALLLAAFYYLMSEKKPQEYHLIGWFLAGIVGGFNLMYLPFILIPLVYSFVTRKQKLAAIFLLLIGIGCWFLPLALSRGFDQAISLLGDYFIFSPLRSEHTLTKFGDLIRDIWASGLGGFWKSRSLITVLTSLALIPCLFFGTMILLSFEFRRSKIFAVWGSYLFYLLWWYLSPGSTNIALVILIPFFLVAIAYGVIYFLVNFNLLAVKIGAGLFFLLIAQSGISAAIDHQNPNAVEKLKEHLSQYQQLASCSIIAEQDICKFLKFKNQQCSADSIAIKGIVILVPKKSPVSGLKSPKNTYYFSGNPFINSWQSWIELREY